MRPSYTYIAQLLAAAATSFTATLPDSSVQMLQPPLVHLSYGIFQGINLGNVSLFLGVPYAQPPLRLLRFAPPEPPNVHYGVRDASQYGAACPQQQGVIANVLPFQVSEPPGPTNISEDCLFINVIRPALANTGASLPVLFWIFGGGFEMGDASSDPGTTIVERSLTLGQPIIFVSANYRLNAFGFLASAEVHNAGSSNVGLRDQRLAMKWVNQYISAFGGDPARVTIWGESAGALSVGLHLVMNDGNTEALFRGAIMESGSPYALRNYTIGQPYYDFLAESTNCSQQEDTLKCLRLAPYEQIIAAVNATPSVTDYTSLNLVWQPRLDGDLFVRNPLQSVKFGLVPFVTGDCDDEGTVFSLSNTNITTDDEFLASVQSNYIPVASDIEIAAVGQAYPSDPEFGSPFGTGDAYSLTSQYKRLAAFQGDWEFQAPRRFFLQLVSSTQDSWAFLYKRFKQTPYLGSYHGSDIPEFFTDIDFAGTDILINFAANLDPNAPASLGSNISYLSGVTWDKWNSNLSAPPLLTFLDPEPSLTITSDTYRSGAMSLLNSLALQFP